MGALPDEVTKNLSNNIMQETSEAMKRSGITVDYLISLLKKELNAKVTKIQKFKGKVDVYPESAGKKAGKPILAPGVHVIAQGKKFEQERVKGEDRTVYDDGDTVVAINEISWDIRQKARIDAQKLLDMYPVETKRIEFDEATLNAILTGLPTGFSEAVRAELSRIISSKRD